MSQSHFLLQIWLRTSTVSTRACMGGSLSTLAFSSTFSSWLAGRSRLERYSRPRTPPSELRPAVPASLSATRSVFPARGPSAQHPPDMCRVVGTGAHRFCDVTRDMRLTLSSAESTELLVDSGTELLRCATWCWCTMLKQKPAILTENSSHQAQVYAGALKWVNSLAADELLWPARLAPQA